MIEKSPLKLPPALVESIRAQRAILFLGAGASKEAMSARGERPPSGADLKNMIAEKFFGQRIEDHDLMSVAEMAIASHGEPVVFEFIKTVLDKFEPPDGHLLISAFRWRLIATTNYDLLIERAHQKAPIKLQTPISFVKDSEPVEERMQAARDPVQLLKLHGSLDHIHDPTVPLILSYEHYDRYSENRKRLFGRLEYLAPESPIIFCGYRLGDAHIRSLIYKLAPPGKARPTYYIVDPHISDLDAAFWSKKNVEVIPSSFSDFMNALAVSLPSTARVLRIQEGVLELPIRKHYRTNSTESATVRSALETDLTLVRNDMSYAPQTAKKFYEGYDTGWGAIAQNLDIQRKAVEELLYRSVLEETSDSAVRLFVVKGPGGSGKTIALKRAAWETATTLESLALWLRPDGAITTEVFSELFSLTSKRVFLFVDRIALHAEKVDELLKSAKQRNIPVTVIGAERHGEWNTYCTLLQKNWNPIDLRLGHLSLSEIGALIDLLSKHDSLGLLAGKARDDQIAAFYEKAERQLLVALHELTHGKPFEDIVYEEYLRIVPERAQQLYLDICTLNQFGVPVRAGTISRISGIRFEDYEKDFFEPLENVVLTGRDSYSGDYQYRSRHSRVASLVFRQACQGDDDKVNQLVRMIRGFDIGYSADRFALENIIRGRSLLENLARAESGRELYEAALDVAPNEGFILQQWAIFEANHKFGSLESAEAIAERARLLDPKSSAIIHTQAEIARKRAVEAKPPLLKEQFRKQARKRLSEISRDSTHVTSTRCKLLVDELSDILTEVGDHPGPQDEARIVEKVRDTEATLARAHLAYPDEPDLLQVEARLRKMLDQDNRAIRVLEKAWVAGPRGSGVPIRLARAYQSRNELSKAVALLESALDRNQDDKQVHLELAKLLLSDDSNSRQKINSHLERSYDKGDANFEARHLHAQFLFMIGKYGEAAVMFREIDETSPGEFRASTPASDSVISARLSEYSGWVDKKESSYVFIKTGFYPSSIYGSDRGTNATVWDELRFQTEIKFRIRFNRKGPVAVDLKIGKP
jgi:tetratricopeptide (TPR) repeat protein